MDRHTPTNGATVLQQRIRQSPDGSQIQSRTRSQILWKNANAALVDATTQCNRGTERSSSRGTTLASTAGLTSSCSVDTDRLALRDADDVIAIGEGCGIVVCGAPEGIAETLGDAFGDGVVPACAGAEAGAAAVDSQGSGEADEGTEGAETCDGDKGAHG